jgi:hypothetical protein
MWLPIKRPSGRNPAFTSTRGPPYSNRPRIPLPALETAAKINEEIRHLWDEYDFTNCCVLGYLVKSRASEHGDVERWRKQVHDRLKLWSRNKRLDEEAGQNILEIDPGVAPPHIGNW